MKFRPGDRVKYLNSIGEGIVSKIIDSRMVMVTGDDGFEIPTLISELVKIDSEETGARYFRSKAGEQVIQDVVSAPGTKGEPEHESFEQSEMLPDHIIRNRKSEDIFLAFIPHDQKWLITGMVDVFLVNNTSFDVIYNLYHRTRIGHYDGIDYGSMFAGTKRLIQTVNRESLGHWTDGCLQFLFHKEQTPVVLPPFNSDFQIDGKKFYKEGSYRESPLTVEKGIIVKMVTLGEYLEEIVEKDHETESVKPAGPATDTLIHKHQTLFREAEIDLHIHELIDDPSNLEKSEILEFQKNYFVHTLDEAIQNHFLKVTFIHGVGNGILRTIIIDHLKSTEGIEFFDAPMAKYGVGAVEVRIAHNPPQSSHYQ